MDIGDDRDDDDDDDPIINVILFCLFFKCNFNFFITTTLAEGVIWLFFVRWVK